MTEKQFERKSAELVENYLGAFNLETRVRLVISFLAGWQAESWREDPAGENGCCPIFSSRAPSLPAPARRTLSINIRNSQNLSLECVGAPLNKSSCGAVNERAAAFCPSAHPAQQPLRQKQNKFAASGGRARPAKERVDESG
jgi:hypothetical protein